MSTHKDRPRFRVVGNDEAPAPSAPALLGPLPGRLGYERALLASDLEDPKAAFRVACSARSLLGAALDIRRAAARHAPEMFPRGLTPGEKSAEAAEVVVRAHVGEAWMGKARPDDLRRAALRASDEIAAARRVAISAGLAVDDVCEAHFKEAADALGESALPAPYLRHPITRVAGTELATTAPHTSRFPMSNVLAALFGGVLLGLLVTWAAPRLFPEGAKRHPMRARR